MIRFGVLLGLAFVLSDLTFAQAPEDLYLNCERAASESPNSLKFDAYKSENSARVHQREVIFRKGGLPETVQSFIAVDSWETNQNKEEVVKGKGLELVVEKNDRLTPQRYSARFLWSIDKQEKTGRGTCQSFDHFRPRSTIDVEVNCNQKALGKGAVAAGPAIRFLIEEGRSLGKDGKEAKSEYIASVVAQSFDLGTPDRRVRLERKDADQGRDRTYTGDGFSLKLDLSRETRPDAYAGSLRVNLKRQEFGIPTVFVDRNEAMECRVFDYVPAGSLSLRGGMTGRAGGADPQGLRNLQTALDRLERTGAIRVLRLGPGGDEGGRSFCVELRAGATIDLAAVARELRHVSYNRRTTSLVLRADAETCLIR